jgi:hypothetical protein
VTLTPTRLEHTYEIGDESGYRFTVVASYDPETGWSAAVSMATHGYTTPEHAVQHLTHSAEAFVRQVKEKA